MAKPLRCAVSASLPLLALVAWAPPAAAQRNARPGQGGPLPISLDLRKVPVGSWAEYRTTYVGMNTPMTERYGLVARTGATVDIESESPEVNQTPLGRMILRHRLSISDAEIKEVEKATQFKNDDPKLEGPSIDPDVGPAFGRTDPKKRIGVESVTVSAGVFPKAEHYHVQLQGKETVDYWTSPDAPPLGLVKVVIKGGVGLVSGSTLELLKIGTGAKPVIVKKPTPHVPGEISPAMLEAIKEIEAAKKESKGAGGPDGGASPKDPAPPRSKKK
jgi:hypothetical protein